MSFTIGKVQTGDEWERTDVDIVNEGIRLFSHGGLLLGGGLGTYTPAQARELGQLLINAADRWSELNASVKQAQSEIKAVEKTVKSRIKDLLA